MSKPNYKKQVKDILERDLAARESDTKLIRTMYNEILLSKNYSAGIYNITASQLITLMHNGTLPLTTTVIRYRAELQAKYPELRGKNYNERQHKGGQVAITATRGSIDLDNLMGNRYV